MEDLKNYDWDLTAIYDQITSWQEDFSKVEAILTNLENKKEDFITSASKLLNFLEEEEKMNIILSKLYTYAKISFDTNMKDQEKKELFERVDTLSYKVSDKLAFFEPQLLKLSEDIFASFREEEPGLNKYNFFFEKLFLQKEHILDPSTEELLSGLDSIASFFEKAYDDLTVNDISYHKTADPVSKEEIRADNINYYLALLNPDRSFREDFFKKLLGIYKQHANSLTSLYYGSVKKNVLEAKKRNYSSALSMALKSDFIDEKIYSNLVDTVRENTQVLQDYLSWRKKELAYDDLHFYDLFLPLTQDFEKTYSFDEARKIILEALAVLGPDYQEVLKRAFDERWLDVFPKENKVSGAYATGVYGVHPYSLLNFKGSLNDIFTIAHELGHVMHSYYSNLEQDYVNSGYTIFCAEVASTVNEQLLYHHLLKKSDSLEMKKYLLNDHLDSLRSTFFRQTLFAEFEKEAHELVENDQPLTESVLAALYEGLYKTYYGKDFVIDEELKYEWARIPHFYSAFYVYQYATGISAAICLADKILNDPDYQIDDYLSFLKSGDSDYSVQLLKKAGVDMSQPGPVKTTIKDFQETLKSLSSDTAN